MAEIWRKLDIYNAFSREEQLEAQLARMHGKLEAIDRMARRGDTGSIIAETDMVMAVDLEDDTDWMMAQRAKRGAALPEGLI